MEGFLTPRAASSGRRFWQAFAWEERETDEGCFGIRQALTKHALMDRVGQDFFKNSMPGANWEGIIAGGADDDSLFNVSGRQAGVSESGQGIMV